MTTIAYDGKALAGDRRVTSSFAMTGAAKIAKTGDGRLIGCAGNSAECRLMMAWLARPKRNVNDHPEFQNDEETCVDGIEILTDGKIRFHHQGGFTTIEDKIFAIGSGAKYAVAAMYCGLTAMQAVEVAMHFDVCTGGKIDQIKR